MITAVFNDKMDYTIAYGLWQWDYGQVLRIKGLDFDQISIEVHFSLSPDNTNSLVTIGVVRDIDYQSTIVSDGEEYTVNETATVLDVVIPKDMLWNNIKKNYTIYVFLLSTNEESGETLKRIIMPVKVKPKPIYLVTPEDEELFHRVVEEVNTFAETAKEHSNISKSYAVGNTGTRENEDIDNAKYYAEQSGLSAEASEQSASNALVSENHALDSENSALGAESRARTYATEARDLKQEYDDTLALTKEYRDSAQASAISASANLRDTVTARNIATQASADANNFLNQTQAVYDLTVEIKQEVDETKADVDITKTEIDAVKTDIDATKADITATRTEIATTRAEVNTAKNEVIAIKSEVSDIKDATDEIKTDVISIANNINNSISEHNESTTAHSDIRNLISNLTNKLNTFLDTDDESLDQISELITFIQNNRTLIEGITTSKVDKNQGIENAYKSLIVGEDGYVTLGNIGGGSASYYPVEITLVDSTYQTDHTCQEISNAFKSGLIPYAFIHGVEQNIYHLMTCSEYLVSFVYLTEDNISIITISQNNTITVNTNNPIIHAHQNISHKADKATTLSGYGITNAYTKDEINEMIPENNLTNIVDGSASGSVRGINTKSEDSSYKMGNNAWAEGLNTMASGESSHAEGMGAIASGDFSHVEGREDTVRLTLSGDANSLTYTFDYVDEGGANYIASFIFSGVVKLISNNSSDSTTVTNVNIENKTLTVDTTLSTEAISNVGYTLVIYPTASGETSHVEGTSVASGNYAHAEGRYTEASNQATHAEGYHTTASNQASHAEGYWTTASGAVSHAENGWTTSSGDFSHAEGESTIASAEASHAEGNETTASKAMAHAEGYQTTASGLASHTEGYSTSASASASHSEGYRTNAEGQMSHTEGAGTYASKSHAHAEGINTLASGVGAHAEGHYSTASGLDSHVEGYYEHTNPIYLSGEANATTYTWTDSKSVIPTLYQYEHLISEGGAYLTAHLIANFERRKVSEDYIKVTNLDIPNQTITVASTLSSASAITNKAYYFFFSSIAEGDVSHAENFLTMAKGTASHSEGFRTIAKGQASHAQGMGTIASKNAQSVLGTYNIEDNSTTAVHPLGDVKLGQYAVIVGNGYNDTANKEIIRSNAHTLDWQGNGWYAGKLTVGSAPTANMDVATKQYVDSAMSNYALKSEIPTVTNDFTDNYKNKVDSLWEDYQDAITALG